MTNHQSSITSHQVFRHKNTSSKNKKERAQKNIPGGTKTKESSAKSLNDIKKSKRKTAKRLSPEAREKKDSSAKSLNDIKKSKRKSAKSYPRRHEKKG